jgi:hypothetical protein
MAKGRLNYRVISLTQGLATYIYWLGLMLLPNHYACHDALFQANPVASVLELIVLAD